MKKSKGVWKKERARRRKFTASDAHRAPAAGTRKKYWVGAYTRNKKRIEGHFRKNPNYKK